MLNENKDLPLNILSLPDEIEPFKEEKMPLTEHEREILSAVPPPLHASSPSSLLAPPLSAT